MSSLPITDDNSISLSNLLTCSSASCPASKSLPHMVQCLVVIMFSTKTGSILGGISLLSLLSWIILADSSMLGYSMRILPYSNSKLRFSLSFSPRSPSFSPFRFVSMCLSSSSSLTSSLWANFSLSLWISPFAVSTSPSQSLKSFFNSLKFASFVSKFSLFSSIVGLYFPASLLKSSLTVSNLSFTASNVLTCDI